MVIIFSVVFCLCVDSRWGLVLVMVFWVWWGLYVFVFDDGFGGWRYVWVLGWVFVWLIVVRLWVCRWICFWVCFYLRCWFSGWFVCFCFFGLYVVVWIWWRGFYLGGLVEIFCCWSGVVRCGWWLVDGLVFLLVIWRMCWLVGWIFCGLVL